MLLTIKNEAILMTGYYYYDKTLHLDGYLHLYSLAASS